MKNLFLSGLIFLFASAAGAQDWSTKQIRIIVPFSPGGIADTSSRAIGVLIALAKAEPGSLSYGTAGTGIEPSGNTPEEYEAQIRADLARWEGVVKKAKIRIE